MSDWRLNGQERYLSNQTLYKVKFPEFWEIAYRDKNPFYQKIASYAEKYVAKTNRGMEYLEGDKIQRIWHQHCEFCWDKALTYENCEFYCTKDMYRWVCAECFHDFKEKFNWQEKPTEELFR